MDDKNPYKCTLNISVPVGKERRFQKIVSPLMKWIDPSFQMLHIVSDREATWQKQMVNKQQTNLQDGEENTIVVPSMSVMLFLYEHGTMSAVNVQNCLKKKPWKFHHKVELHSKRTPDRAVAAQEFYSLAEDLPLWSVCPVHCGNEHFRVLYHVRNFQKMMEFYRCVTDMEIESSKPGFCIFQMYSQPGLDIQLALKHSPNIQPNPVQNACLTFQIKNMDVLKTFLDCKVEEIADRTFLVEDPDGNYVMLQEQLNSGITTEYESLEILQNCNSCKGSLFEKSGYTKSLQSSSDSQDSGRCSDSDVWAMEAEPFTDIHTNAHIPPIYTGNECRTTVQSGGKLKSGYASRELSTNYRQWNDQTQLTFDTTRRKIISESTGYVEAPVFL